MPTFNELAVRKAQEDLVRKALDGGVFRAPVSAPHISAATLFAANGSLQALPTGFTDVGLLSTDGIGHGRDVSTSDIGAFGRFSPVRSDVTGDTDTMTMTAIETNLNSIELGSGATLLPGSRSNVNGSLEIKKPPRPSAKVYRFLSVAVDENDAGEIYVCRYFPRGKITAFGDQPFGGGDTPIQWPATVTAQSDSTYGGPSSWIFGGPGWNSLLVKMGFTAYTPAP